jgi:hypothetical protein
MVLYPQLALSWSAPSLPAADAAPVHASVEVVDPLILKTGRPPVTLSRSLDHSARAAGTALRAQRAPASGGFVHWPDSDLRQCPLSGRYGGQNGHRCRRKLLAVTATVASSAIDGCGRGAVSRGLVLARATGSVGRPDRKLDAAISNQTLQEFKGSTGAGSRRGRALPALLPRARQAAVGYRRLAARHATSRPR